MKMILNEWWSFLKACSYLSASFLKVNSAKSLKTCLRQHLIQIEVSIWYPTIRFTIWGIPFKASFRWSPNNYQAQFPNKWESTRMITSEAGRKWFLISTFSWMIRWNLMLGLWTDLYMVLEILLRILLPGKVWKRKSNRTINKVVVNQAWASSLSYPCATR